MKNIIVVEDNAVIRKLFSTILKKQGYEVADFPDGESALAGTATLKPDLLILDILLPDINGTDLITKLRTIPQCRNTPAIAVTGFATAQDELKFKQIGFNAYLSKPIDTTQFIETIKSLLN